jgi:UDP-GlcNAc:undecaprenyl-phosphate GlcNAc-1-phosphate transferase
MSTLVVDAGRVAAIAFAMTAAGSPVALWFLRHRKIMDVPSERSSHVVATPRGGGIACLIGLVGAILLAPGVGTGPKLLLVFSVGAFAVLGFADDLHNLRVRVRLGAQIAIAAGSSGWAIGVHLPTSLLSIGTMVVAAVGLVWIVAYVNAFNFMDGINGLAGAAGAVAGATFAVIGLNRGDATLAVGGAAVGGASLAFLPWNFPSARFFLGDVGSYLLGGTTALLLIVGLRARVPLEALFGPEVIFLADTGWTLLGRISRGEDWTSPHRTHVYQQLQVAGTSHTRTTVGVTVVILATSLLGLVSLAGNPWARMLADVMGIILLIAYLASPSILRRPARRLVGDRERQARL